MSVLGSAILSRFEMLVGYHASKARLLSATAILWVLGCSAQPEKTESTISLGRSETFSVSNCVLWGHVVEVDGKWTCGWSIEAEAVGREFNRHEQQEHYVVQPVLAAYAIPIQISSWRSLDGIQLRSLDSSEPIQKSDASPNYSLRTTISNERCIQNSLSIRHLSSDVFRVHWTGKTKLHGIKGDEFALDSAATFTGITISAEFDSESEAHRGEVEGIIKSLFPTDDFELSSMHVERFNNEGKETFSVVAEFSPAY